jgi:hypothetical protein
MFSMKTVLEQEVPLRERQHVRRFARQQHSVGPHLVGLRINLDARLIVIQY